MVTFSTAHRALTAYVLERKLTHARLAKLLGVSRVSVTEWLGGKKTPSLRARLKLQKLTRGKCRALDWDDGMTGAPEAPSQVA